MNPIVREKNNRTGETETILAKIGVSDDVEENSSVDSDYDPDKDLNIL